MKRCCSVVTFVGAALLALLTSGKASEPAATIDLITHNSVVIDAPADKIWPHIVEPSGWKLGVVQYQYLPATVASDSRR